MALRCLTSLEANNKVVNLMQLTSEAMASIWETDRTDYQWYTSAKPDQYVINYGDDLMEDFFSREWISSGQIHYTIENSNNSYFYREYNTAVGARNITGIQPNGYSSANIMSRYRSGEVNYLKFNLAIVIDDDTENAIIVCYFERSGTSSYSTFYRLQIYTGTSYRHTLWLDFTDAEPQTKITSNGGGATHIAKVTGQLKDLSSNLSDILMVSGGGGGGLLSGETDYSGKEASGISGSGDNSADQSTGNAFGQGESGTNVSGGGSGLYGGYKGTSSKSGGAGSGYIGNLLISNKKMVGYNVPTSSAEGTKTESVNDVSASAVSGKPKSGNGHAKIKFLREIEGHIWSTSEQVVGTWINGEPLYEITFYKDSDFAYNNMNNLGALPENFERMVYARGYVQRDGNTEFDVFNTGDAGPVIQIKVINGYFGALVRGYAMISMAVTFRYTKSSN